MADLATLEVLADTVIGAGAPVSAAALHGAVCGFAVFDTDEFPFFELADQLDPDLSGADPGLVEFVEATRAQLAAEDFGFAPLLPEEDVPPMERLAALGLWCDSFLQAFGTGLGRLPEAGGGMAAVLPGEIQEIVEDMAAIAEVDLDDVEDADEDIDAQLMELEEFVKVGVLLIMSVVSRGLADQDD